MSLSSIVASTNQHPPSSHNNTSLPFIAPSTRSTTRPDRRHRNVRIFVEGSAWNISIKPHGSFQILLALLVYPQRTRHTNTRNLDRERKREGEVSTSHTTTIPISCCIQESMEDSMASLDEPMACFMPPCSTCIDDEGGKETRRKCELVGYEALPEWLKDNEFILGYYRYEWPMRETLLSVFAVHNETLNVWSHLIGFFLFLCLTIFTAMVVPMDVANGGSSAASSMKMANVTGVVRHEALAAACLLLRPADLSHGQEVQTSCPPNTSSDATTLQSTGTAQPATGGKPTPSVEPVTRWPLFAFLCGAMLCLLTSSVCHLILCHSERTAYVTLRLDYAGIATLIVTSFYPLVYYTFLCEPHYRHVYMGFITAFGAAAVTASLVPAFQSPEFRPARAALFSCMGVSGLVPIAHKLALFRHRPEAVTSACYETLMGALYGLGVAAYAARVPERWMPGRFDVVGHSHQLFHLFVIAGAYTHYLGGLEYLKWRDSEKCW